MRLAVCVEFFPPRLGSDRRIYEIMSRLSNKHDIHFIVVPPFRALSGRFLVGDKELARHFKGEEDQRTLSGIRGHFIQIPRLVARIWKHSYEVAYLLTLVILFPRIVKTLRKIHPEMMVLNYPSVYTGVLGFAAAKLSKIPVLLDFNDLIAQYSMLLLNLSGSGFKAKLFFWVQDSLVRRCDKVVATTRLIRDYAIGHGASQDRVFLVPNGVDTDLFCPKPWEVEDSKEIFGLRGKTVFFYGGRLDDWAGIDIIKGLCKELREKKPETQFLVVGGRLASREHLDNLVVIGETPYETVPQILNMADAVLVPFPDNVVSRASSPLKLFEGMAMRKPIIASRVDGIEDIVTHGKNGMLVDSADSVKGWCKAIESVLKHKAAAKKMGWQARRTAIEKYDWNHLAGEYEKLLRRYPERS